MQTTKNLLGVRARAATLTLPRSPQKPRRPKRRRRATLAWPNHDGQAATVALGYVSGGRTERFEPHRTAIHAACEEHGWELVRVIRETRRTTDDALGRPGLAYALEQLASGSASRLVVSKFEHLASSVSELRLVLPWLMKTGTALSVVDVGLNSDEPEGRTIMRALLAVTDSEPPVTAPAGVARAGKRATGLPAGQPELGRRVRDMRAAGMTLQAIADTLNEAGVPPLERGARWRRSSVEAMLV